MTVTFRRLAMGRLGVVSTTGNGVLRHPLTRLVLFAVCTLSLIHGAHRFRFTLYDGLQIKHLNELINLFCYGGAIVLSIWAGYLLWRLS